MRVWQSGPIWEFNTQIPTLAHKLAQCARQRNDEMHDGVIKYFRPKTKDWGRNVEANNQLHPSLPSSQNFD